MRVSAYARRDARDSHERWCDYMVARARGQRVLAVKPSTKRGVIKNNYLTSDLRNFL